jgi:hypothetical protein
MKHISRVQGSLLVVMLLASFPARNAEPEYRKVFPGVWTEREAAPVREYLADAEAIRRRGPIDVKALVEARLPASTPGLGPVIDVTEDWVRYNNRKYDPENPLLNSGEYARQAGFSDISAYLSFGAHDDSFMIHYPGASRDRLLVSELNHEIVSHTPIHPGDRLFLVADERELLDLTPAEGATWRSLAINYRGSIYNQNAVRVSDVIFRVVESIRVLANDADRPVNADFGAIWVGPDWMRRRPHYYTDEDWQWIRGVLARERRRGAEPLYWQDVKVGDRPVPTLDGPVEVSVSPVPPWGMGSGGSRSIKAELLNPKFSSRLIRGRKDGIFRLPSRADYMPAPPSQQLPPGAPSPEMGAVDSRDIHREGAVRSPLVNYMGRDYAIRHLSNWMGERGTLRSIAWSIMDPRALDRHGLKVAANPRAVHWLNHVPALQGRFVETHGLTQDIAYIQSEVVAKYVRDGRASAELVWWVETIEGQIWEEGKAIIELPLRPDR